MKNRAFKRENHNCLQFYYKIHLFLKNLFLKAQGDLYERKKFSKR